MPKTPLSLDLADRVGPDANRGPASGLLTWLQSAARLAGRSKALHTALALASLAATEGRPDVRLTRRTMALWSQSRDAAGDALRLLQAHRLALVWSAPGRARVVVLTQPGTVTPLQIG